MKNTNQVRKDNTTKNPPVQPTNGETLPLKKSPVPDENESNLESKYDDVFDQLDVLDEAISASNAVAKFLAVIIENDAASDFVKGNGRLAAGVHSLLTLNQDGLELRSHAVRQALKKLKPM